MLAKREEERKRNAEKESAKKQWEEEKRFVERTRSFSETARRRTLSEQRKGREQHRVSFSLKQAFGTFWFCFIWLV